MSRVLITLLMTVAAAALLLAPRAAGGRGACAAAGSRTLVANSHARVYESASGYTYACSYHYGRHLRLDTSFGDSFGPYAVNRHYVAYLQRYYEGSATYYSVVEQSLSTGRERFADQNGPWGDCGGDDDCGGSSVARLLMKRNGSLAWIACDTHGTRCRRGPYAVLRHDRRGARLLDQGARIDPDSLRITRRGARVVWTKRGEPRHATLR